MHKILFALALTACAVDPTDDPTERNDESPTELAPAPEAATDSAICSQVLDATHYVTAVTVYATSCVVTDSMTTSDEACNPATNYVQGFNGSSWGGTFSGGSIASGSMSGSVARGHSITMTSRHWGSAHPTPQYIYRTTFCPSL